MSEPLFYSEPVADDWLLFADEQISTQEITEKVRNQLKEREVKGDEPSITFPTFTAMPALHPVNPTQLYQQLNQITNLLHQLDTFPILAPSPAMRIPILGWLWSFIRLQAHQLILFYLHRQAAHTVQINQQLLTLLHELVRLNVAQQEKIDQLQQKLESHPPIDQG